MNEGHVVSGHDYGQSPAHTCDVCDYVGRNKTSLIQHKLTHSGYGPYICGFCDIPFDSKRKIMRHMGIYHSDDPLYTYNCGICVYSSMHKEDLLKHMTSHMANNIFMCKTCNCTFIEKKDFTMHICENINESSSKTYRCSACHRMFNSSYLLSAHIHSSHIKQQQQQYPCDNCDFNFSTKYDLQQHKILYKERIYECKVCDILFCTQVAQEKHKMKHVNYFECDTCNKVFDSQRDLLKHWHMQSVERPYKCKDCDRAFSCQQYLYRHKQNMHILPFKCEVCHLEFRTKKLRAEHIHLNDRLRIIEHLEETQKSFPLVCSNERLQKTCKESGLSLQRQSLLNEHQGKHTEETPQKCYTCNSTIPDTQCHRTNTSGRPYQCEKCHSKTIDLIKYHGVHVGQSTYECDKCNLTFPRSILLESHKLSHSTGISYTCKVCGLVFHEEISLTKHLQVHPDKEPPKPKIAEESVKCQICDKTFRSSSLLKYHKMKHKEEWPFICEKCGLQCRTRSKLLEHQTIHTGEKRHKCDICNKRFRLKNSLKLHKNTHTTTTIKCNVCEKSFRQRFSLAEHMRIHTGEKPYKCEICNEEFRNKYFHLRHHVKFHLA